MATKLKSTASADVMPTAAAVGEEIASTEVHLGEVEGATAQPTKLPPNTPYYIAIHPSHWHVSNGLLIPSYKTIPVAAGVEGAVVKNGSVVMDGPKGVAARRGYTVLPTAIGGKSYLTSVQVPGGTHYLTIWETARSGEDTTDFDEVGYHAWVWALVNAGKIPGPSSSGLRRLRADLSIQHLKAASKAKVSAEGEAIAAITDAALKTVDAEIARSRAAAPVVRSNSAIDLD